MAVMLLSALHALGAVTYFGNCDSAGALTGAPSTESGDSGWYFWLGAGYTCPGTGAQDVVELAYYCGTNAGTTHIRIALYDVTGTTKIAESAKLNVTSAVNGWIVDSAPTTFATITPGTNYVLVVTTDSNSTTMAYVGNGADTTNFKIDATAINGFPQPLVVQGTLANHYAIRAGVSDHVSAPPSAPTGLTATAASASQINLAWTDNSSNETGFIISRSTDGVTYNTNYATAAANATSYNDTGLNDASTYYYKVRATNAAGDSSNAGPSNATTPTGGAVLSATVPNDTSKLPGANIDVVLSNLLGGAKTGTFAFDNYAVVDQHGISILSDLSSAKIVLSVTGSGFDSSGNSTSPTRTVYGTRAQRKFTTYPGAVYTYNGNEVSNDGTDTTARFVLSSPIYSGETVSASVSAGLYTLSTITSKSGVVSVTNSTTRAYEKPAWQWRYPDRQRVTGNFAIGGYSFRQTETACVKFTVTDAHSHSWTSTVSASAYHARPPTYTTKAIGAWSWDATVDTSSFTAGDTLTIRAQVYPRLGSAAFDTNSNGSGNECTANDNQTYIFDPSGSTASTPAYASVDNGLANDSGGSIQTTIAGAQTHRYKTMSAAWDAGANVILCYSTTTAYAAPTNGTVQTSQGSATYYARIIPDPAQGSAITLQLPDGANQYWDRLEVSGFAIKPSAAASADQWHGQGADRVIWIHDCSTVTTGTAPASPFVNHYRAAYFYNLSVDNVSLLKLGFNSTDVTRKLFDGCTLLSSADTQIGYAYRMVGCYGEHVYPSDTSPETLKMDNEFVNWNVFLKVNHDVLQYTGNPTAMSFSGNVYEVLGNQDGVTISFFEAVTGNVKNVTWAQNTFAAYHLNFCYASTSTPAIRNPVIRGNAILSGGFYNAGDDDASEVNPATYSQGNWEVLNMIGGGSNLNSCHNWTQSNNWGDYRGYGSSAINGVGLALGVTNDQSGIASAAGSGGGDYNPTQTSLLKGALKSGQSVLAGDMFGTAISNSGSGAVGAIQPPASPGGNNHIGLDLGIGLSAILPCVPYANSDVIGRMGFGTTTGSTRFEGRAVTN